MRATISFDIGLNEVESVMGSLVSREGNTLRKVVDMLEGNNYSQENLLEELNQAMSLLAKTAHQLQQYQEMLVNFEKAKFETMLPQPATQAVPMAVPVDAPADASAIRTAEFANFVERMSSQEEEPDEPQEG